MIAPKLKLSNISDWSLLASNLLTITLALVFDWSVLTLLWGYWLQSVIIGFFHFLKMIAAIYRNNNAPVVFPRYFLPVFPFFFAFHYGFFHFGYFAFLGAFTLFDQVGNFTGTQTFPSTDFLGVLAIGIVFFINHAISFFHYTFVEKKQNVNLQKMMFEPYGRIVPMHLTIMFGGFATMFFPGIANRIVLLVFLSLKTAIDLSGHIKLHRKKSP